MSILGARDHGSRITKGSSSSDPSTNEGQASEHGRPYRPQGPPWCTTKIYGYLRLSENRGAQNP